MENQVTLPTMEAWAEEFEDDAQRRSEAARAVFETSEGAAEWMTDYWQLLAEGWPWRLAVYMLWVSQPKDRRHPATQGELARQVLGLTSDRAIREWREKNPAMEARTAKLAASVLSKARADIYQALITAASNPSPRANADRKLALEMLGDYVPRQQLALGVATVETVQELSTEELAAIAHEPSEGDGRRETGDGRDEREW